MRRPAALRLRRPDDSLVTVASTVLAVLAALVALVGLVLHAVDWTWQWLIVGASFSWAMMWLAPVAVVLAALARRWVTVLVAVALTAFALTIRVPSFVAQTPPSHGTHVEVMQANLKLGSADPKAIVSLVRRHHVELLATEELTIAEQQRLIAAGLAKLLPYRFTRPIPAGGAGLGMWSRYPLHDTVDEPNFYLGVEHAALTLPGGRRMTFVAAHITPPYPYPTTRWRIELPGLGRVLGRLPHDEPLVLAGDLNTTVDHAPLRTLLGRGYADAADQAGSGYGATYPADRWFPPVIAIDHVLTRRAVATSLDTLTLPGSDHRGLLASVTLDPAPQR